MADVHHLDVREDEGPDRGGPSNIDAEQGLLGCVLFDPGALDGLDPQLPASAFFDPTHARLWTSILAMVQDGQRLDPVVLMNRQRHDAGLGEMGGLRYLADLIDRSPPSAAAPGLARVIRDLATRREIIWTCGETARAAMEDTDTPADELLARLESAASSVAEGSGHGSAWIGAGTITTAALDAARTRNGALGLSTGLHDLDRQIGGLRKGQLVVIAGRPSMGKSTAALQVAKAVSRKGRGVAFFSLEMPDFDLGLRMACDMAHDPMSTRYSGASANPRYFDAANGRLSDDQWRQLDAAREEIASWPLAIDTRPSLTVSTMTALARRRLREWERAGVEPGCIIVDHLTIVRPEQDRRGNRVAEVGDISRGLAEMAKLLDVPAVALCQLSRDVEKRDRKDRRPGLPDLRWSGEIEQDARVVTFLYRPEYYLRQPEDGEDDLAEIDYRAELAKVQNKLFWLVEKNNNGPTGQVETYCDIASSAIRDRLGVVT